MLRLFNIVLFIYLIFFFIKFLLFSVIPKVMDHHFMANLEISALSPPGQSARPPLPWIIETPVIYNKRINIIFSNTMYDSYFDI